MIEYTIDSNPDGCTIINNGSGNFNLIYDFIKMF